MDNKISVNTKIFCAKLTLPLIMSIVLSSCGGGDSSSGGGSTSGSVTVNGSVNTADYPLAANSGFLEKFASLIGFKPAYAVTLNAVDTLVAIPSQNGNIDVGVYEGIKSATISSDGSFNLTLTKEYDWVLLLVNSKALTADDKVVAYATVPASASVAADGSLVDLPFSAVTGSEIDLGEFSASSDPKEARSDKDAPSIEASLSLSLDDLKKYAQGDNAYRHFVNIYLNYLASSGEYYFPHVEWRWSGKKTGDSISGFTDPTNFKSPSSSAEIETNTSSLVFNDICNSAVSLGLFPPENVTINGQGFSPNQGLMYSNMSNGTSGSNYCYNSNSITASANSSSSGTVLTLQFPLAETKGLWRLKKDSQQIAQFDFALASPLDTSGNPLNFVPSIRVNRDTQNNDKVNSIDVQWLQYDSDSKTYKEVKDDEITNKLVGQSIVETVDYSSGANGQDVSFGLYDNDGLISGNIALTGQYQWYFGTATTSDPANGIAHITDISVSYMQGGVSYRFTWGEK